MTVRTRGFGGGGGSSTPADGSVTNAKLADMAQARIKGRAVTAGTGAPTDLTGAETMAILTASNAAAFDFNTQDVTGVARLRVNASAFSTVEKLRVNTPTTADVNANVMLAASGAAAIPLVIQLDPSQTANGFSYQLSSGTERFTLYSTGRIESTANVTHVFSSAATISIGSIYITGGSGTRSSSGLIQMQNAVEIGWRNAGNTGDFTWTVNASDQFTATTHIRMSDAKNIVLNATTGTKIGTATTQKLGLWNATPIVQPTTAIAASTFAANTSGIVDDTATFDGYTLGQVVKALRNMGALA